VVEVVVELVVLSTEVEVVVLVATLKVATPLLPMVVKPSVMQLVLLVLLVLQRQVALLR
jgi:hypothetical protein